MLPYETIVNQCKCPICGREFFPPEKDMWGFKIKRNSSAEHKIKVCSWHCQRVWERNHQSKRETKKYFKVQKELAGILEN